MQPNTLDGLSTVKSSVAEALSASSVSKSGKSVDRSRMEKILLGQVKPADEREALQATMSIMWKKAFHDAMKPIESEPPDALSAPQAEAIRDRQSTWMGIEVAWALSASIGDQLDHVRRQAAQPARLGQTNSPDERGKRTW